MLRTSPGDAELTRRARLACLALFLVALPCPILAGEGQVLWEDLSAARFPSMEGWVSVLQDGVGVPALAPSSFRLSEDGVDQPSLRVYPENGEMDVILVVDTSGSMREALARSVAAVRNFLTQLGPRDRVALVGFSDLPRVLQPLTTDLRSVDRALNQLRPDGGTALYDTLVTASSRLKTTERRHVVVLLTDGEDQNAMGTGPGSRTTLDQAVAGCRRANATVYAIGLGFQVDRKVLGRLTSETGGQAYWAAGADALRDLYLRIGRDMHRRYRVVYETQNPARDGTRRSVRLTTQEGAFRASGDTAYRAPGRVQSASPVEAPPSISRVETPAATWTPTKTDTPTPSPTATPTRSWTPTPTASPTPTVTDTPTQAPVPSSLTLQWDGRELGARGMGELVVFAEGQVVSASDCQIVAWPGGRSPEASFYLDRRVFLSPGRYLVRSRIQGRIYEAVVNIAAGLPNRVMLIPSGNP